MIQISEQNRENCCGCSACAQICPRNCITMEPDEEGFLYPRLHKENCVNCNQCVSVCPVLQKENLLPENPTQPPRAIGGWHKDDEIRNDSSSGGAFSLFALFILNQGGIVYGSALDENLRAGHIGIETIEDLGKLRGSKYVQSDINNTYSEIKKELQKGRQVLFTGTPCQAAGLNSFLSKNYDNLLVMDFICHGVPSPMVFQDYVNYLSQKHGDKVIDFKFRMKDRPWSPTGMQMGTGIRFRNGDFLRHYPAYKDSYMNGFLDDVCLRPSCYHCAFKCLPKYYSDITIADFWGADKAGKELCDGKGTSLILLHSSKGNELFRKTKSDFFYKECDFIASTKRNPCLTKSVAKPYRRNLFFKDYNSKPFSRIVRKYMSPVSWLLHKTGKIAWKLFQETVKKILGSFFRLFHIFWSDEKWEAFFQFTKFVLIGMTNTLLSYLLNISVLAILKEQNYAYDYIFANITAFLLSVLWSYHWNSRLVFTRSQNMQRSGFRTLLKTYIVYGVTGLFTNNILSTIWIHVLGISKFLSPLLNLPFSLPINFLLSKFWAYKDGKKGKRNTYM